MTAIVCIERNLLRRAQQGDLRAVRQLFARHHAQVYRFAHRLLGAAGAACGVVEDAFARAHAARWRVPARCHVRAWLLALACTSACQPHLLCPGAAGAPSGRLAAALAALPFDRRAAWLLRADHRLGHAEIARAMGWSEADTRLQLAAARAALRRALSALRDGAAARCVTELREQSA